MVVNRDKWIYFTLLLFPWTWDHMIFAPDKILNICDCNAFLSINGTVSLSGVCRLLSQTLFNIFQGRFREGVSRIINSVTHIVGASGSSHLFLGRDSWRFNSSKHIVKFDNSGTLDFSWKGDPQMSCGLKNIFRKALSRIRLFYELTNTVATKFPDSAPWQLLWNKVHVLYNVMKHSL